MTCHCFLRPIRRGLPSSSYTNCQLIPLNRPSFHRFERSVRDKLAVDLLVLLVDWVLFPQGERKSVRQIVSYQRFVNSCLANSLSVYCVRGTRICVGYSVHYYWVSCAINKGGFFRDCICVDTHLPRFEAIAYVLPHFDVLTYVVIRVSSAFIFQTFSEVC